MKKKLLVLLITVASTMMPNLASAIAIDVERYYCYLAGGVWVDGGYSFNDEMKVAV